MFRSVLHLGWLICCLLTCFGCSHKVEQTKSGNTETREAQITPEEYEQFAIAWQNSVLVNDEVQGINLCDVSTIINSTVKLLDVPEGDRELIAQAGRNGELIRNLFRSFHNASQGGDYHVVAIESRQQNGSLLFRLIRNDGGVSYHELHLVKQGKSVRYNQILLASSGQTSAELLASTMLSVVARQNPQMGRDSSMNKDQYIEQSKVGELLMEFTNGNHQQVIDRYDGLTKTSKQNKQVQLAYLRATAILVPDEFPNRIRDYRKLHPEDPALYLLIVDHAYDHKNLELLQSAYEWLRKWTNGDPYLNVLVGVGCFDLGNTQFAAELFQSLKQETVVSEIEHQMALDLALKLRDYDAVLRYLIALREKFGTEYGDLTAAEVFRDFVLSKQFEVWKNRQ